MAKGNIAKQDLVIVTKEGNKIVSAGDIIEEATAGTEPLEKMISVSGTRPRDAGTEWQGGRPLEIITSGIKKKVSRSRLENEMGDMDCMLPDRILAHRKKLVMDRMKQERGQ